MHSSVNIITFIKNGGIFKEETYNLPFLVAPGQQIFLIIIWPGKNIFFINFLHCIFAVCQTPLSMKTDLSVDTRSQFFNGVCLSPNLGWSIRLLHLVTWQGAIRHRGNSLFKRRDEEKTETRRVKMWRNLPNFTVFGTIFLHGTRSWF